MSSRAAVFDAPEGAWVADTCDALRDAWQRGDVTLEALARGTYPGRALPRKALPGLKTVGYWDASRDQTWHLDWHRNEGIELTFLARGGLRFAVGRQSWQLHDGDLTITRPWQRHRVGERCVTASRLFWLILDVGVRRPHQPWKWPKWLVLSPEDLARLTTLLRHCEQPVWHAGESIAHPFERIADVLRAPKYDGSVETRLTLAINELLVALLDLLESEAIDLDRHLSTTLRTVEMFLEEELPSHVSERWDLESMARQCGLGRTRFAHYCQKITNMTPIRYLASCRVERACEMLVAEPQKSITRVALDCGFDSGQYFATVFRQVTGASPREFRERRR